MVVRRTVSAPPEVNAHPRAKANQDFPLFNDYPPVKAIVLR